jgi:hypothetical protein
MSTKTIRIAVEQVLHDGAEVPDDLAIGRCNSQTHDVGVAWPARVAKLSEMACPLCGGPLTMTTRQLRRPFHLVSRQAARAQARRARATAKATLQANVVAGRSKLARGLAPGDVLHREASRRGHPVRVVDGNLPGERKSHVGLRVQVPLETLRQRGRDNRLDEQGCYLLSLPAGKEVRLAGEAASGYTWPASAAEVRVAVARRDLEHAEQMLADANERQAADPDDQYRASSVTAWTDRVTQCLAQLDAALAALDRAVRHPEVPQAPNRRPPRHALLNPQVSA